MRPDRGWRRGLAGATLEREGIPDVGPAILRLALSAVFLGHGAQKLFGFWGGGGLAATASFLASLGLGPAGPLALVFGVVELAGGLLLLAGAYTRWVAPLLVVDLAVVAWKAYLVNGFFLNWTLAPGVGHGIEYHVVLVAALICLMFTGPGAISVDAWRHRAEEAAAAGLARIRAGKV
jgi:putative oxidoreductase